MNILLIILAILYFGFGFYVYLREMKNLNDENRKNIEESPLSIKILIFIMGILFNTPIVLFKVLLYLAIFILYKISTSIAGKD